MWHVILGDAFIKNRLIPTSNTQHELCFASHQCGHAEFRALAKRFCFHIISESNSTARTYTHINLEFPKASIPILFTCASPETAVVTRTWPHIASERLAEAR